MIPTASLFSKASRLPLTSKMANKNYYKGTGSLPRLRKRQGKHSPGTKSPYVLLRERMRTFVVPDGLDSSELLPYVSKSVKPANTDWPVALDKETSKNYKALYTDRGFDGRYYIQLVNHFKS